MPRFSPVTFHPSQNRLKLWCNSNNTHTHIKQQQIIRDADYHQKWSHDLFHQLAWYLPKTNKHFISFPGAVVKQVWTKNITRTCGREATRHYTALFPKEEQGWSDAPTPRVDAKFAKTRVLSRAEIPDAGGVADSPQWHAFLVGPPPLVTHYICIEGKAQMP